jgi:hypothetical protein
VSFKKHEHEGKKPWEVEPFRKLTAVQVYYELGAVCEGCLKTRSKFLYAAADGQALDLCTDCSNEALEAGAIENGFHLQNYSALTHHQCVNRGTWHELQRRIDKSQCNIGCTVVGKYARVSA